MDIVTLWFVIIIIFIIACSFTAERNPPPKSANHPGSMIHTLYKYLQISDEGQQLYSLTPNPVTDKLPRRHITHESITLNQSQPPNDYYQHTKSIFPNSRSKTCLSTWKIFAEPSSICDDGVRRLLILKFRTWRRWKCFLNKNEFLG